MTRLRWLGLLAGATAVCAILPAAAQKPAPGKWVSGFYVGYMADRYPPSAIDFSSLTHLMVFALLPHGDGTLDTRLFIDPVTGPKLAAELATRARAAGRVPILAIGGENTEAAFRGATQPERLDTFVRNIIDVVTRWGFDGVDIDWEPISPADHPAILTLVRKLKAAKPGLIVTTDVPFQTQNFPLGPADRRFFVQLAAIVDQFNMMTYSMADSWDGWVVWHASALAGEGPDHPTSVAASARQYLAAGVPASKIGIGIGFYGACWSAPATAPLDKPMGAHVLVSDNEMSFATIKSTYFRADRYRYDTAAQAPYLSFLVPTGRHKCTFVSYEDEKSIAAKGQYVESAGLGGTIVWQLNEGYVTGDVDPSSLLRAVGRAFKVAPAAPQP